MPGQPNRKPGVPGVPVTDPVTGGVAGVGNHSIDADWAPTNDAKVLAERLERKSRQVEKLKRDRGELKIALKLKTEEAFVEGQLSIAPIVIDIRKRLAGRAQEIVGDGRDISDEDLKFLKVAMQSMDRWEDRAYGKTRQRVDTTTSNFSADLTELMMRGRVSGVGELELSGDVVEAEIVDEEVIE